MNTNLLFIPHSLLTLLPVFCCAKNGLELIGNNSFKYLNKPLFFDNGLFYGVMLYPFMSAADEVSQPQSGDGQSRPGKCEVRADLTEDIIRQM